MQSRAIPFIIFMLALSSSVCFGQVPAEKGLGSTKPGGVGAVSFPYVAEIVGKSVNIRSGPGMNYYRCGRLSNPDRVMVVGQEFGWSRIEPPRGSFSWISKQYIKPEPNEPGIGIVTGDEVHVWAGSRYLEPIHSVSLQRKLNIGDTVGLLGEEKGDYYKIAPPAGVYLWVSTQYTQYLGPAEQVKLTSLAAQSRPVAAAAVPVMLATEAEKLKRYYKLSEQVEAEHRRPATKQNYADIKQALLVITKDPNAGKAARYARFLAARIKSFELAIGADEEVQLQDSELAQRREQIRKTHRSMLGVIRDLGRFAVIGRLKPSQIYGSQEGRRRHLVVDGDGRLICYAQPAEQFGQIDLEQFGGRKVGLVGSIEADVQSGISLVRFTEIVDLDRAED